MTAKVLNCEALTYANSKISAGRKRKEELLLEIAVIEKKKERLSKD